MFAQEGAGHARSAPTDNNTGAKMAAVLRLVLLFIGLVTVGTHLCREASAAWSRLNLICWTTGWTCETTPAVNDLVAKWNSGETVLQTSERALRMARIMGIRTSPTIASEGGSDGNAALAWVSLPGNLERMALAVGDYVSHYHLAPSPVTSSELDSSAQNQWDDFASRCWRWRHNLTQVAREAYVVQLNIRTMATRSLAVLRLLNTTWCQTLGKQNKPEPPTEGEDGRRQTTPEEAGGGEAEGEEDGEDGPGGNIGAGLSQMEMATSLENTRNQLQIELRMLQKHLQRLAENVRQTEGKILEQESAGSMLITMAIGRVQLTELEIAQRAQTWSWPTTLLVYGVATVIGGASSAIMPVSAPVVAAGIAHFVEGRRNGQFRAQLRLQNTMYTQASAVLTDARTVLLHMDKELLEFAEDLTRCEESLLMAAGRTDSPLVNVRAREAVQTVVAAAIRDMEALYSHSQRAISAYTGQSTTRERKGLPRHATAFNSDIVLQQRTDAENK